MSFPSTLVSAHIRVVVASYSDWMMGGAKVNFKVIKPPNQSESLVFNGGVHFWMSAELSGKITQHVRAILEKDGTSSCITWINDRFEWHDSAADSIHHLFDFQFQTHDPVQRCLHLHTVHTSSYVMVEQVESTFDVPGLCLPSYVYLPSLYHIAHISPFTNDSPHTKLGMGIV